MATKPEKKSTTSTKTGADGKRDLVLRVSPEMHDLVTQAARKLAVPAGRIGARALGYGVERAIRDMRARYEKLQAVEGDYQDDEAAAAEMKAKLKPQAEKPAPPAPQGDVGKEAGQEAQDGKDRQPIGIGPGR